MEHVNRSKIICDIDTAENILMDNYVTRRKTTVTRKPKLRTYICFKVHTLLNHILPNVYRDDVAHIFTV